MHVIEIGNHFKLLNRYARFASVNDVQKTYISFLFFCDGVFNFYSYSAVQGISGMEQGATAFVGCDGNKVPVHYSYCRCLGKCLCWKRFKTEKKIAS